MDYYQYKIKKEMKYYDDDFHHNDRIFKRDFELEVQ